MRRFLDATIFDRQALHHSTAVNKPAMWIVKTKTWPLASVLFWFLLAGIAAADDARFEIKVEPNHAWRPPFGLARIDGPVTVTVTSTGNWMPTRGYHLDCFRQGRVIQQDVIQFPTHAPLVVRRQLPSWPDQVVLRPAGRPAEESEIVRQQFKPPTFEADAVARPSRSVNPVDLGFLLFPEDRLLLRAGQKGIVKFAAISRAKQFDRAQLRCWFESNASLAESQTIRLDIDKRVTCELALPPTKRLPRRDVLRVGLYGPDGNELWQKKILTRIVHSPPDLPSFGATQLKLNYELPIVVYEKGGGGAHTELPYDQGWDAKFHDVVVSFPNGARFVFWRGASYIPFWAGTHNTGFTYEWAESTPPKAGEYVDAVEPLMDKELRYARVQIMESTPARVHVRWTYQSCDFHYKVWGDSMQEDFYFYPDAFGTRVLTYRGIPDIKVEVSELIVLTAPMAYPLNVLPENLVDFLFTNGDKHELKFPRRRRAGADFVNPNNLPPIYRIRIHQDEQLSAIYHSPWDRSLPYRIYMPFEDQDEMVTMAYWGSHWPLSRGQNTGRRKQINDGIAIAPAHNSIMTWGNQRVPLPLTDRRIVGTNTLGEETQQQLRRWAWLIGMTDASDEELIDRARSYGTSAPLQISGADSARWDPTSRSFRIEVDSEDVELKITPREICVNPVLVFAGSIRKLNSVLLDGIPLAANRFVWDGKCLWLVAKLTRPAQLALKFEPDSKPQGAPANPGDPTPK